MRILFAGDEHPYSAYALKKVIEMAGNTWADITLLGVCPPDLSPCESPHHPVVESLRGWRDEFFSRLGGDDSPYAETWGCEWILLQNRVWEQIRVCRGVKKKVTVYLRTGNPADEILNEAEKEGSDLIVLGCGKGPQCVWKEPSHTPRTVLGKAGCSVLVVKEDKPVDRILACVDQTCASQESMEMINQMVTIHKARLELVGLTKDGSAKPEAYSRLIQLGDYFSDRGISVKNTLADVSEFENLVSTRTDRDLAAFWMGKKSLLTMLFPKEWTERLISASQSSVLVLR